MSLRIDDHTCENCGLEYRGRGGKRRKFCGVCQAHRDITYLGSRGRSCEDCGKMFYPWRTNYRLCYRCQDVRHGIAKFYPEPCNVCGEHNRVAPGLTETCCGCVQDSLPARQRYHKALSNVIRERLTNPTTQEATA